MSTSHRLASFFLSVCLFFPVVLHADPRLDAIKARYAVAGKLDNENCGDECRFTVTCSTMQAAIGLQTTAITFFKISDQVDPEEDPYLVSHELVKVKVTYNVAASAFYTIEYLYDSQEALVFYYLKEEIGEYTGEKRFYYAAGRLFHALADYQALDGKNIQYEKDGNFSGDQTKEAAAVFKKAADYKKLFDTLVAAEEWR